MKLEEVLRNAEPEVRQRGESYYKGGAVLSVSQAERGVFNALVEGSDFEPYDVRMRLGDDGEVVACSCDCPYEFDGPCKHLVAVALAIRNGDFETSETAGEASSDALLCEALESASKEELAAVAMKFAQKGGDFRNELLALLGRPDRKAEISATKDFVKLVVRENTSRGFVDYRGCNRICAAFDERLHALEERFDDTTFMFVFDGALEILLAAAKLASHADSSSGALTDTIDFSLSLLKRTCDLISKRGSDAERGEAFEMLLRQSRSKAFDGWGEWGRELLLDAVFFLNRKNESKFARALDCMKKEDNASEWSLEYAAVQIDLIRLAAVEKLDGPEKAEAFIDARLEIDEFRRIAINRAVEAGRFMRAEALCLEKLKKIEKAEADWRALAWRQRLYEIYECAGDEAKRLDVALSLLLKGETTYYDVVRKVHIAAGTWGEAYAGILRKVMETLSPYQYMPILRKEKELDLLMDEVRKAPSSVFDYGADLSKKFGEEVFELCRARISREAQRANDRRAYKGVCELIERLKKFGGTSEASATIEELREKFKRRPAMLDELGRLEKKL